MKVLQCLVGLRLPRAGSAEISAKQNCYNSSSGKVENPRLENIHQRKKAGKRKEVLLGHGSEEFGQLALVHSCARPLDKRDTAEFGFSSSKRSTSTFLQMSSFCQQDKAGTLLNKKRCRMKSFFPTE